MKTALFSVFLCALSVSGVCGLHADPLYLRYVGRNKMVSPPFAYTFDLGNPGDADIFYVAGSKGFPSLLMQTRQTRFDPWSDLTFSDPSSNGKDCVRGLYAGRATAFGVLHGGFQAEFRVGAKYYRTRSGLDADPSKWPEPEIVWSDAVKTGDLHEGYVFGDRSAVRPAETSTGITPGSLAKPVPPGDLIKGSNPLDVRAFAPQPAFPVR